MDIVIAIVALPFRGVWWVITHPKVIILVGVIVLGFFGVRTCNKTFAKEGIKPAPYQVIAPSVATAPTIVQTGTRLYYVSRYTQTKESITLLTYYVYNKKTWQLRSQPLVLDKKYYGDIKIYERKK